MPLLQVSDLRTSFHTRAGVVRAVDGVSFEVHSGETLGLVGESGCGKSVTALSLMKLLPPIARIEGEILFEGRDLLKLDDRGVRSIRGNRMAMIFQDPMTSLNPVIRIGRQITEVLEHHLGMGRKQATLRAEELLELVGIPDARRRADDYPHQFSGGMRQRVMIALALSCNPRLVIADEPTTALDVTIQAQVLDVLANLSREAQTATLLITHDLGVVAGITQRVSVMYAGRIVETAMTADLFASPQMPYTWGLLRSVPRLDRPATERLVPIEGLPPDLTSPPSGCRFEPRCDYRRSICKDREPDLAQAPGAKRGHLTRCWGTQDQPGGGWLLEADRNQALGIQSAGEVGPSEGVQAAQGNGGSSM